MSEKFDAKGLSHLFAQLETATAKLQEAQDEENDVSRRKCSAQNTVTNLQKQIDREMEKCKSAAPWNTEWHGQRHRGIAVK